jgi:hypothetical protein
MLEITIDTSKIEAALDSAPGQIRYATQQAINKTAWDVRDGVKKEMPTVFDRPTPYTVSSLKVFPSKASDLTAEINFKGRPSGHYLRPEVFGGARPLKTFEKLLGRGFYVPSDAAPKDRYGNVSGAQILRMLSMLGANREGQNQSPAKRKMRILKGVKQFYRTATGNIAESGSGSKPAKIWFYRRDRAPQYKPLLQYNKISKQIIHDRLSVNIRKGIAMAFIRAGK